MFHAISGISKGRAFSVFVRPRFVFGGPGGITHRGDDKDDLRVPLGNDRTRARGWPCGEAEGGWVTSHRNGTTLRARGRYILPFPPCPDEEVAGPLILLGSLCRKRSHNLIGAGAALAFFPAL